MIKLQHFYVFYISEVEIIKIRALIFFANIFYITTKPVSKETIILLNKVFI